MLKALFGAAMILAVSGPAFAASAPSPAAQPISTAGVDLADPAQAKVFLGRLREAATAVCDSYSANSRVTRDDFACADRAVRDAVRQLDRPTLTAAYEGRSPARLADGR